MWSQEHKYRKDFSPEFTHSPGLLVIVSEKTFQIRTLLFTDDSERSFYLVLLRKTDAVQLFTSTGQLVN